MARPPSVEEVRPARCPDCGVASKPVGGGVVVQGHGLRTRQLRGPQAPREAGAPPGPCVWLLAEWPRGEKTPTRFWLASLPPETSKSALVWLAKLRWRVERDYQEMKSEVGLDHYEGRTWSASNVTSPSSASPTPFSRSVERFSPRTRWTLPDVRRQLQQVLLRRVGACPLCRRLFDPSAPPRGPSRI